MNNHYDADALLEELGSTLRTDILLHLERDLVAKIPFFAGKVPQFVADTLSMLQPMVFQLGDTIVREGSQADEMYFLVRGRATVLYGEKEVLTIEAGSYFGEIGCIMGGIRRASIKAVTVVELQALSRRNLNILLCEYPEVAEELNGVAKHRAKLAKGAASAASAASPSPSPSPEEPSRPPPRPLGLSARGQQRQQQQQQQQELDSNNARKMEMLLTQLESTLQQLNALLTDRGNEGVT